MSSNKWFEKWFDSPYYDILYRERDAAEASGFIDALLTFLKPPQNAKILDAACGQGRHAVYLNSKGYDVTGIDLSRPSIWHAQKSKNKHLSFFIHDMRRVFHQSYFDYVFNFFTSFGYFDTEQDNIDTITALAKALKKDGTLVIDFMNTEKVIRKLKKQEHKIIDNIEFDITRTVEDAFIVKKISITDRAQQYHFEERVKGLTLKDFERYCILSNLKILNLFGDYNLNDFDANISDRLIIIAQKIL